MKPGKEITEEEYKAAEQMAKDEGTYKRLSSTGAGYALSALKLPVHDGFMIDKGEGDFCGYGWTNYQRGVKPNYHYYFIGPVEDDPKRHGTFYHFDCMTDFGNDNYFHAEDFADDNEAIKTGADYEADIYKVIFDNGAIVKEIQIYTPYEGKTNIVIYDASEE